MAVGGGGALSIDSATATDRPGVAKVLNQLSRQDDAQGIDYRLASMPAFRRIWLKAGESKLDLSPAFAITPDGALELNYDDPVLAALGGAGALGGATPYDSYDGRDPKERASRSIRSTHAMIGVQKVMMLLAQQKTEIIK